MRSTHAKADLHLEQICSAMMESWFPADDEVLNRIRGGLHEGRYSGNRSLLVQELKEDHSLFLYCIRELIRLLNLSGVQGQMNPLSVLEKAGEDELKKVLDVDGRIISHKRREEMSASQAARMFESAVSATAAETLAAGCNIDENLAFACSIFRQLGLTLIAWNYPFVYKRVVATLGATESLDSALERVLGFSPSALGIAIGRRWRLSDEVLCGMGDEESKASLTHELKALAERLNEVCSLGDTVGRASAAGAEVLPAEWEKAKGAIRDILGVRGLSALQSAISANCSRYGKVEIEAGFSGLFGGDPGEADLSGVLQGLAGRRKGVETNPLLGALPEESQSALTELYARSNAGAGPNEILQTFVAGVLPLSGFTKGAVYLLQPDGATLLMSASHGRCDLLPHYRTKTTSTSVTDPITAAFRQSHAISERNAVIGGKRVSFVAGVLGESQRRGVLYAEVDEQVFKWLEVNPMNCFRAIEQGLADCLGIE